MCSPRRTTRLSGRPLVIAAVKVLAPVCHANYSLHLDSPLGKVLYQLKTSGDPFYRQFLKRIRGSGVFQVLHCGPGDPCRPWRLHLLLGL